MRDVHGKARRHSRGEITKWEDDSFAAPRGGEHDAERRRADIRAVDRLEARASAHPALPARRRVVCHGRGSDGGCRVLPGVDVKSFWGALLVAVIVSALNAVIPPVLAALKLPLTPVLGFLLVLIADAAILLATDALTDGILTVDNFGWALLASLVVAAVSVVLAVLLGSDDMSSIRTSHRIARRQGIIDSTDVPGIVYLEIDGLALPILQRAMRDGNAPNMARWARETHRLAEWETDLSSQTGASQAGILLGSNEDISAFSWVEKRRPR